MSELDLALDLRGWLRLFVGLPFLLGPGIALADRWIPGEKSRFILAPVASISLLTVGAFLLDLVLGIGPTLRATFSLSVVLTIWIGWPRLQAAPRAVGKFIKNGIQLRRPSTTTLLLPLVVAFVMLVQALPHLPGEAPSSNLDVYPTLAERAMDGIQGDDYPYPIHVDEHIHFAFAGKMIRDGVIDFNQPYTDVAPAGTLFSVEGFRSERGFTVALVQIHDLLGTPLAVLFRFLPAIWAGYLALVVWFTVRGAPGALIAAGMVAVPPSTARFLGMGFLISSPFGLPWIFAALAVTLRAKGPPRFFGIMLLVTAAYFQHLVIGTLTMGAALGAMAFQPRARLQDRIGILVATLLPMLWILPGVWSDVQVAIGGAHSLPFVQQVFAHPGALIYGLAVLGSAWAYFRRSEATTPHRVLAALTILMSLSLWLSIENDHRNDATYSRLVHAFFLTTGILASLGIGGLLATLRRFVTRGNSIRWSVGAIVTLLALAPAIHGNLTEPIYRVHNEATWLAATTFESSGATADDVFLGEPWRAPIWNAVTGARPHAVLYPGTAPTNGADWAHYVSSGGANQTWLEQREIRYIVHGPAPNAPHTALGNGVFRLT